MIDPLFSFDPVHGDFAYWNYETVDISPDLKIGKNIIIPMVLMNRNTALKHR